MNGITAAIQRESGAAIIRLTAKSEGGGKAPGLNIDGGLAQLQGGRLRLCGRGFL